MKVDSLNLPAAEQRYIHFMPDNQDGTIDLLEAKWILSNNYWDADMKNAITDRTVKLQENDFVVDNVRAVDPTRYGKCPESLGVPNQPGPWTDGKVYCVDADANIGELSELISGNNKYVDKGAHNIVNCPESHPFAYDDGNNCCATPFEDFNDAYGRFCDG